MKYEYADPYTTRAFVLRKQGEYARAIADCNKAIEFEPEVRKRFGEPGAARYAKAVFQWEGIESAYAERSTNYLLQNKLDESLEDLNKAIRIDPKCGRLYLLRSRVYRKIGRGDKADADMTTANSLELKIKDSNQPPIHD